MGSVRIAGANRVRRGVPVAGALLSAAALVCDSFNQRIRVLAVKTGRFYGRAMTVRDIYTIAGNGSAGYSGDGGPATATGLYKPLHVIVDAAGNLVFCERDNRIRMVAVKSGRFYGRAMTARDIYTIAGSLGDGGPVTSRVLVQRGRYCWTPWATC